MTLLVDADFGGPAGSRIAGRNAGVGADLLWASEWGDPTPLMDGVGNVVQEAESRDAILAMPPAMFTGPFTVALRLAAASSGDHNLNVITVSMGGFDVFLMNASIDGADIIAGATWAGITTVLNAAGKQIWFAFDPVEMRIAIGVGEDVGQEDDVVASAYGPMYFDNTNLKLNTYPLEDGSTTVKLSNLKVDGIGSLNMPDFWTEFAGAREVP